MKLIVELDGPVLDVQGAYWEALTTAAQELGLARPDPASFWRIVRGGKPISHAVVGAKPAQSAEFDRRFWEVLEEDRCLNLATPHPGLPETMTALRKHTECTLVTVGRNRTGRQALLDKHAIGQHFMRMLGLAADKSRWKAQLVELADTDPRVVVAFSTPSLLAPISAAGFIAVGVGSGASTPQRLTQAGAALVVDHLDELEADLRCGAPRLMAAGLLPVDPAGLASGAKRMPR